MQQALIALPLFEIQDVSRMLVFRDETVLLCSCEGMNCNATFPYGLREVCLMVDEADENYLAVMSNETENGLRYAALIDLRDFYERVVSSKLTSDYWMVLYRKDLNFYLQNDSTQAEFHEMTYENALTRNDGITIVAKSEQNGEIIAEAYEYPANDGSDTQYLLMALPTAQNENGLFAVGVAVDSGHFLANMKDMFWKTGLYSSLVLFGVFVLLFGIFHSHIQNRKIEQENQLLFQQNEAIASLLEKQNELAHHQRLETIGTLTSGIAHEFNNLLTPIMGYSVLSLQELDENDADLKENLSEIYEAATKAKSLVARVSALSRKNNDSEFRLFSPDSMLDKVQEMTQPSLPKNVRVVLDYHCPDVCLYLNETQIAQMMLNIVVNAFHAMQDKDGVLTIRTEKIDKQVIVTFSDNGCGIPPENIDKVFEPFFTTKGQGHGTGLGLAIVKQIAEEHHGQISLQSQVNVGTTVTVSLPIADENIINA